MKLRVVGCGLHETLAPGELSTPSVSSVPGRRWADAANEKDWLGCCGQWLLTLTALVRCQCFLKHGKASLWVSLRGQ